MSGLHNFKYIKCAFMVVITYTGGHTFTDTLMHRRKHTHALTQAHTRSDSSTHTLRLKHTHAQTQPHAEAPQIKILLIEITQKNS